MVEKSKAWIYDRSFAGIAVSDSSGAWYCVFCVLPDKSVCGGPVTRPEESYRLCCVQMSVIEETYGGGLGVVLKNNII